MLNWRVAVSKLNQDKDKMLHTKIKCAPQQAHKNCNRSVQKADVSGP